MIKCILRLGLVVGLAIVTQVGALSYLLSWGGCHLAKVTKRYIRFIFHLITYLLLTLFLIPPMAFYLNNREPITVSSHLKPANYWLTIGFNRNYVTPELNQALRNIASDFAKHDSKAIVLFLDASFPFFDGYPLLPHLSHNDGRKVDLSYVYEDDTNKQVDFSPAFSGYGYFEGPQEGEQNTTALCKENGYFQYDYPKYLTLGVSDEKVYFSEQGNKQLINAILNEERIKKVFIEPHLVKRLEVSSNKIRFHGCRSVRHDDHIHIQL